ncbi:MAG: DUF302 domain-containing protein [Gammaproteobacteria bacterium]|nr:MAG: DUF302 domain-containing protein [Gammaproteobacteria bacterium]
MKKWLIMLLLCLPMGAQAEDELLMARSQLAFPEAMQALQDSIKGYGYKVSRVQRVDIGLTTMGYKTDKYRVVFFAKYPQMKEMVRRHPEVIPYLPLKIAIFAEGDETILVAANPKLLAEFFPEDSDLHINFIRCSSDMKAILREVQEAGRE